MHTKKAILLSAPSGSGKTTIIRQLLQRFDCFEFSISATCRAPRVGEKDGEDYYFLSRDEFINRVAQGDFVEWEEVYEGTCYGTLKSELTRIWNNGHCILFDVDVKGGMNLAQYFGDNALSLFIMPPSIEVLEQRLRSRGTDQEESIRKRLRRADEELRMAPYFDHTIINNDLERAVKEVESLVRAYLDMPE